ncbi:hypothetical protein GCM10009762_01330 [Dermacoccus barathri]|uniref:Uncharacterized protein n=1 Tax=Dermacoccus barathri TaxID=322601 RepID=A0ABN2AZ69_9MICO
MNDENVPWHGVLLHAKSLGLLASSSSWNAALALPAPTAAWDIFRRITNAYLPSVAICRVMGSLAGMSEGAS